MPNETKEPLKDRAERSLFQCFQETGRVPSAISYRAWRSAIPPEDRVGIPSSSAIVPYVWTSWNDARAAAGISQHRTEEAFNGPRPKWTRDDCLDWVGKWIKSGAGSSLAAFGVWIEEQREAGEPAPSVSTVRLRLARPWSKIVIDARERLDV